MAEIQLQKQGLNEEIGLNLLRSNTLVDRFRSCCYESVQVFVFKNEKKKIIKDNKVDFLSTNYDLHSTQYIIKSF